MTAKPNILCIEDNLDNQRVLDRSLRRNYRITMKNSVAELMEYLGSNPEKPLIVLSDVNLSDNTGASEMFEKIVAPIQKKWRDVPVVAVTAKAMAGDKELLLEICDGYLAKPINKTGLMQVINDVLNPLPDA